jgi:hypothetical protein
MIRGLQPRHTSVHLLFGGLYATALEHFYKHRALGDDIDTALRKIIHEALIGSWDYTEDKKSIGPKDFDDPKKTRVNLIRTIVWYIEQFAEETEQGLSTYILQNGVPAVELSFTLEIADHIVYCGHLDRVSTMGGSNFVVDQKTTGGTVGPYYFKQFSPDNQMSGYSFAGRALLKTPIRGVIIDAAQIAVNFTRFERSITTRTQAQLDEWLENTLQTIDYMRGITARAEGEASGFPMNLASCGNYGGCPFRNICGVDPSIRENYIRAEFVEHNWDPLEAR